MNIWLQLLIILGAYFLGFIIFGFVFKWLLPKIKFNDLENIFGNVNKDPNDLFLASFTWPIVLLTLLVSSIDHFLLENIKIDFMTIFKKIYFRNKK